MAAHIDEATAFLRFSKSESISEPAGQKKKSQEALSASTLSKRFRGKSRSNVTLQ